MIEFRYKLPSHFAKTAHGGLGNFKSFVKLTSPFFKVLAVLFPNWGIKDYDLFLFQRLG